MRKSLDQDDGRCQQLPRSLGLPMVLPEIDFWASSDSCPFAASLSPHTGMFKPYKHWTPPGMLGSNFTSYLFADKVS